MKISFKISVVAVLLFIITHGFCQTAIQNGTLNAQDYRSVFGSNWIKAENFVAENQAWIFRVAKSEKVDCNLAISVVFPELIRYSAIRDRMEITLLKALYKNYGNDYANFSIGVFQIKPSCAEELLDEISSMHDRKFLSHFRALDRSLSEKERRAAIISDLENPQTEFYYVLGMLKVMDKKFSKIRFTGMQEKLGFFATAYNCGFSNSDAFIRKQSEFKTFHTGLFKPDDLYSYADIATFFYSQSSVGIFGN